jgi:Holliday junction DNA helicase RuvA
MIGYLEGTLREKSPTRVLLDVQGVGYEVQVPLSTFSLLPDEGKTVALRVYTHVREEAIQLYGFQTAQEKTLFELLIRTSGVGPKLAQAILSGLAPEDLIAAVRQGDPAVLRAAPGVGLKTAQRIVIELRDRIQAALGEDRGDSARPKHPSDGRDERAEQVISALLNLGTPRARAERAAREALEEQGAEGSLESVIRAALQRLTR